MIHCLSAIWIWITLSSTTKGEGGETGREEIQRARGMAAGELVVCWPSPVCPQ